MCIRDSPDVDLDGGPPPDEGPDDEGPPPDGGEATECETDDDCIDACPEGSIDCVCFTGLEGAGFCVAGCDSDADCPDGFSCVDAEGICGPDSGADEGPSDEGPADDGAPDEGPIDEGPLPDEGPDDGAPGDGGVPDEGPPPDGGPADEGPSSCESDIECEGACPEGSTECICFTGFDGTGFCVSGCDSDDDCPDGFSCVDAEGICGPEGSGDDGGVSDGGAVDGGPVDGGIADEGPADEGPTSCEIDEDCDGECPEGATDCLCFTGFDGLGFCVSGCIDDLDCPDGFSCIDAEGICGPGGATDGGTPDEGPSDVGTPDEGPSDLGSPDEGEPDLGPIDDGPSDVGEPDEGPSDVSAPDEGPVDGGPTPCELDGDCVDACPPDSLDCVCFMSPDGAGSCVPACIVDDDCPGAFVCIEEEGICGPGPGDEESPTDGGSTADEPPDGSVP